VYTYPEVAPFAVLFALPLHLRALFGLGKRIGVLALHALAVGIALVLLVPGARPLWSFFESQRAAARVTVGIRPGGAFAAGLASSPYDPSAWWALGAEHGARSGDPWPWLLGLLLTGLALAGMLRLWRLGHWGEVAALGLIAAGLVHFMLVERYGYAAYKILSVGWWLVGRCVVEGCTLVLKTAGARARATWIGRLGYGATVGALVALLLVSLFVAERHRFQVYFPRAHLQYQPPLASLARLRSAAASQPPMDAMVSPALGHPFMLPWIFYALKDTPIRLHHDATLTYAVPGGGPWTDGRLPTSVVLPAEELRDARPTFTTPEFALVDLAATALITSIENPNRIEAWGTWLGTQPITLSVLASPGSALTLSFEAAPGPSRPGSPHRTLVLQAGSRLLGRFELDGHTRIVVPFVTIDRREVLTLSTPDTPTIAVTRNGDTRPLLVSIRELKVTLRPPQPAVTSEGLPHPARR
jgi:hypothetical protein